MPRHSRLEFLSALYMNKENKMRFLVKVNWPNENANAHVASGKVGETVQGILEQIKPEAVYFGLEGGERTMFMIVNLDEASQMPSVAEPMFLELDARIEMIPVMTPEDLAKANL